MMGRVHEKTGWLVMGAVNLMIVLISAAVIYCSHQSDVGVGFLERQEDIDGVVLVYSTSEMKGGGIQNCHKL